MINKIILSLLLISGFSYGKTVGEFLDEKVMAENEFAQKVCESIPEAFLSGACDYEEIAFGIVKTIEIFLANNSELDLKNISFKNIDFSNADPYNNENMHYLVFGQVLQRIDANSMLVRAIHNKKIVFIEGIPKNTSILEEQTISLMVKGNGEFKYQTAIGSSKIVPKGIWINNNQPMKKKSQSNQTIVKDIDDKPEFNINNTKSKLEDILLNWDSSHNSKNMNLNGAIYSSHINYYKNKNEKIENVIKDKDRLFKKYPEFNQTSELVSFENIENNLVKIIYKKHTFYNNKNRVFNSYLIIDLNTNLIVEENDL